MSTHIGRFRKSPIERKRYVIDYSAWLDIGETLLDVSITVSPDSSSPLAASAAFVDAGGSFVVFYLDNGNDGSIYRVGAVVQTSQDQVKEDVILLQVQSI